MDAEGLREDGTLVVAATVLLDGRDFSGSRAQSGVCGRVQRTNLLLPPHVGIKRLRLRRESNKLKRVIF